MCYAALIRFTATGKPCPPLKPLCCLLLLSFASAKDHFEYFGAAEAPDTPLVTQLIALWQKENKRVFIVDWKLLNTLTAEDLATLKKEQSGIRIILPSRANIPQRWLKVLEKDYTAQSWSDPTEAGDDKSAGADFISDDEDM